VAAGQPNQVALHLLVPLQMYLLVTLQCGGWPAQPGSSPPLGTFTDVPITLQPHQARVAAGQQNQVALHLLGTFADVPITLQPHLARVAAGQPNQVALDLLVPLQMYLLLSSLTKSWWRLARQTR
jgi:hypothetical protein